MDHISYHGTNKENANLMVGPPSAIDVNIGKGELGKGFYTGTSIAIAVSWANKRYDKEAYVVKIEIQEKEFVKLKNIVLTTYSEVNRIWKKLKKKSKRDKFKFGTDYVIAPFATVEIDKQLKFESKKSEKTLNSSTIIAFPCN